MWFVSAEDKIAWAIGLPVNRHISGCYRFTSAGILQVMFNGSVIYQTGFQKIRTKKPDQTGDPRRFFPAVEKTI
jgi:hypothetical protein